MDDKQYEQKYTDGYNNGYLMSRFEPDLYKQVMAGRDLEQPYFKGMTDGHKMVERELFLKNRENCRKQTQNIRRRMQ